jgi:NitT/TauT family transport system substrate-binding protein
MRRVVFIAAFVLPLLFARGAGAQDAPEIKVATSAIDLGSEVLDAADLGLFKKAGLNVTVSLFNSGSAVAAAVAGGAVDIGQSSLVALANAHTNGLPFVIVAPAGIYTSKAPTAELLVAKDSTLRTAADLEGKTVAVGALQDITQIGVEAWMDRNSADYAKVKFLELPQSAVCNALVSHRVDAGVIAEPQLSIALANGCRVLAACHDSIAKEFLVGAWFTTAAWAKAHPDAVRRFQAVITETAHWANAHHAESLAILNRYGNAPAPTTMTRVVFVDKLVPAQMQPLIAAAARYGAAKANFPAAELLLPPEPRP